MATLELESVSRSFIGVEALKSLSMTVLPGRVTGLIGPNGAGKTTVVNLITGLLRLSGGRILLDDKVISDLPPHAVARLGVARTFQNIRLLREASVRDNILAGFHLLDRTPVWAQALGMPSVRRTRRGFAEGTRALMSEFGMDQYADSLAGELSYGHQRRVEMMRALSMQPAVLLLDEPVAGMNDVEATELASVFRRLADRGLALLMIEHNMELVMKLCDFVYVLDSGQLIAEGVPAAVRADSRVIEAYLGAEAC